MSIRSACCGGCNAYVCPLTALLAAQRIETVISGRRRSVPLLLVILCVGCSGSEPPPLCATSILDHFEWKLLENPKGADRPGDLGPCIDDAISTELWAEGEYAGEYSISVITRECSRATLEQPIQEALEAGEPMQLHLAHYPLETATAAEGLLELELNGQALWSTTVPIPVGMSPADYIDDEVAAPATLPEGTPIRWHVENHGTNSWNLLDITVMRPCPEEG